MIGGVTHKTTVIGLGILLTLAGVACGEQQVEHPTASVALDNAEKANAGEPVARVNGRDISVDEFENYWQAHPDLDREEALERVIERELLAAAALERELVDEEAVRTARKRAMVRQLLDDTVEQKVTADDVDEEMLEKAVEGVKAEVGHPVGLRASHFVVMVSPEKKKKASKKQVAEWMGQSKEWIDKLRTELPAKPTVTELMDAEERYDEELPEPLQAHVDLHLAFPAEDTNAAELPDGWNRVVPPFRERAVELARDGRFGALSEPVKTQFGWHVMVVEDVMPAKVADADALREVARWRVLRRQRQIRFGELFEKWATEAHILTYPEIISQAEAVNE